MAGDESELSRTQVTWIEVRTLDVTLSEMVSIIEF